MHPFVFNARIPSALHGLRLDTALASLAPDMGIRAIRRLFETHDIRLNGKAARKGQLVCADDLLSAAPLHDESNPAPPVQPLLLACHNDLLAFLKPANMHCAQIKGIAGPSLEAGIEAHAKSFLEIAHTQKKECPPAVRCTQAERIQAITNQMHGPASFSPTDSKYVIQKQIRLLTRLDYETSGIVLAAATLEAESLFRNLERAGGIEKWYLALIRGTLKHVLHISNRLDMNKRTKTRVLPEPEADSTRHTRVFPIAVLESDDATLVRVRIKRGARHQIRAHLASAGFPLVHDALYGNGTEASGHSFLLHHYQCCLPDFTVTTLPTWDPRIQKHIECNLGIR